DPAQGAAVTELGADPSRNRDPVDARTIPDIDLVSVSIEDRNPASRFSISATENIGVCFSPFLIEISCSMTKPH
ncbi:MAG: hypothetical protein VYD61_02705, partial [SAR324 cluster bacterium]|nr:hypothetical protein [SAR324 cluster bacterium]